jgi:hypothetical protein
MELLVWNALVYFVSMSILGAALWKAGVLALLVTVSAIVGYGKRWIYRIGLVLMFLAVFVAFAILPAADQWGAVLSKWMNAHFVP